MDYRFIHLLYVPTMACNMMCKYCYLEDNTVDNKDKHDYLETLNYAVSKFKESGVIPFNISLHGGEVTTLSKKDFKDIVKYINNYYDDNRELLKSFGFKVGSVHIKTNLYNIDKHIDTIKKYNVSISGSLDLPLSLHNEYRVTKGGNSSLDKILSNIKLLDDIPNKKKVSSTIFKEHFDRIDEIINDIKYLDKNTCLDMNDFNFMIGFDYNSCGLLHHMSEEEMVTFYKRMHKEFDGTNLDSGVNGAWFDEFGPNYCSSSCNCGEKFFLLMRNGDIYSCVRGQLHKDYYYGNIYKDSVNDILNNARTKMFKNHNNVSFDEECSKCGYLYLCKTGCPFVKNVYKSSKSYTCLLQKELYKDRGYSLDVNNSETVYDYVSKMRSSDIEKYRPSDNSVLRELILNDNKLKYIYDDNIFILEVDGNKYKLSSQLLKNKKDIIYISSNSKVYIYMKKNVILEECDYPVNNSLYIMLLSGNLVTYGDENRTKQEHVATLEVYKNVLDGNSFDDLYYKYQITDFILLYKKYLTSDRTNNIFFTTSSLRNYHYSKQKNNAYYHIETINLPFQNMDFYYVEWEMKK